MPKFSIITPCYNSSAYITTCYQTISAQTVQDWEWVIVDDCSTDMSMEILKKLTQQDVRIKLLLNEKNIGPGASRNRGIDYSTGEYISFLDIDDGIFPHKLENQLNFMINKNADFTFHYYLKRFSDGMFSNQPIKAPDIVNYDLLLKSNFICNSTVMINKKILGNLRYPSNTNQAEDYLFWLNILKQTQSAHCIPETLGWYRVGNIKSLSGSKIRMAANQWRIYRHFIQLNLAKAAFCFFCYAVLGIIKHRKK